MKINKHAQANILKIPGIVLIVVWLQSASILTKAFTGILLNSYFNVKTIPIVNTLDELYTKTNLDIVCNMHIFDRIPENSEYTDEMLTELKSRSIEYNKRL